MHITFDNTPSSNVDKVTTAYQTASRAPAGTHWTFLERLRITLRMAYMKAMASTEGRQRK